MNMPSSKTVQYKIRKGLNLPIAGAPNTEISAGVEVKTVALLGNDYVDMKPTMLVNEGDRVKLGQAIFSDKKVEGVIYTSPASGIVKNINRGDKRAFLSVEIEVQGDEAVSFQSFSESSLDSIGYEAVKKQLLESGEWVALRSRPFGKTPDPATKPHSLFITAMDTSPLAPSAAKIIGMEHKGFLAGVRVLKQLTAGETYVCVGRKEALVLKDRDLANTTLAEFSGPHPAGLAGTHIHFLDPVSENKSVWHINYQDVIAIGHLFLTGKLYTSRIVSIAGPQVQNPRLLKTRLGANVSELSAGETKEGVNRLISGSPLNGRNASAPENYLGRFHSQISVLKEGTERVLLGWKRPGLNKFSIKRSYVGGMIPGKKFEMTTSREGSERAMVPIGMYESVMPLDILPTQLLRSLMTTNTETAAHLGALELIEEDLALCTFVCPGKMNYDEFLRKTLNLIEKGE